MNQKAIEQLSELIDQRVSEAVKRAKRKRALEREAIVIAQYVEQPEGSGRYYITGRGIGFRIAIPGRQSTGKIKQAYDKFVDWAFNRGGGYTKVMPDRNLGRFGVGQVGLDHYRR